MWACMGGWVDGPIWPKNRASSGVHAKRGGATATNHFPTGASADPPSAYSLAVLFQATVSTAKGFGGRHSQITAGPR